MSNRQKTDLPQDQTGHPVQALSFTGNPKVINFTTSSANTTLPTNVQGGWVIRAASTEDCYIAFGDAATTATVASFLFPKGVEYLKVPKGATHVAAVRVTTSGVLSVVNVE